MQTSPLKQNCRDPYFKIVKNLKNKVNQIYINTLTPKFSYKNHKGEFVVPKKCILM